MLFFQFLGTWVDLPCEGSCLAKIVKGSGCVSYINFVYNNKQATISAFWLVESMSINPKSVQKSEIECKNVKVSANQWN